MDLTPTPSQTIGPFFHFLCAETGGLLHLAGTETTGERIRLAFRLFEGDGRPMNDGMIEIWQADAEGRYHHPLDLQPKASDRFLGFGRLATNEEGVCVFETIKPGRVPSETRLQAPHINVSVFGRGILKRLATRVYFAGDPANDDDPILTLVPTERRRTLLATPDPARAGNWGFDIHLCGDNETVFFDI